MRYTQRVFIAGITAFAIVGTGGCSKSDTTTKTDSTTTPAPAPAPPSEERFSAVMDGLSERPTTLNTGATGTADFTFTSTGISYTITVTGLSSNPVGAHIHGPADINATAGPLVNFDSLAQTLTGTISTGTIDPARMQGVSIDSLKTLIRTGMAYVNVHTTAHKDGEIRGQIVKR